ncbi:uncharacterized protein HKW66_Vig0105300 [Vigna angularis]|uniref:Uncharacterized protein n=1 Tax=Phaseolus angularis TaxID=3914 RepID=A0A8T0KI85_PHAAN|nr:uncharacterized protein HKW66_Vig0105300 [Vigna angularis]
MAIYGASKFMTYVAVAAIVLLMFSTVASADKPAIYKLCTKFSGSNPKVLGGYGCGSIWVSLGFCGFLQISKEEIGGGARIFVSEFFQKSSREDDGGFLVSLQLHMEEENVIWLLGRIW